MDNKIPVKYLPVWRRYLEMLRGTGISYWRIGQLFIIMMEYYFEGKEPQRIPRALRSLWVVIRKDLDDARHCYEKNVRNGTKGGRKKKQSAEAKNPEKTQKNPDGSLSTTTSTTTSTTMSTSIDTGSAPAESAGVCCEPYSFGEFGWVKLTNQQYEKLRDRLGCEELERCITYVDEAAQSTGNRNRWKDWYLIVRRCHENRWYETRHSSAKQEIPKGATGYLGEAELEAIQRVLRDET